MITFEEIFQRALSLFDDPDISIASVQDPVAFDKKMRPFLIDACSLFTAPSTIVTKLYQQSSQQGKEETFVGDGGTDYNLSTVPVDNAVFSFYVAGKPVVGGSYNAATGVATFPSQVTAGTACSVAWYFAGAFTADFSRSLRGDFDMNFIINRIKDILAYGVTVEWDNKEMNRALDMRNIPYNTDFKISSPANSAKAKVDHHTQVQTRMNELISDLGWYIQSLPVGGTEFGQ